MPTHTFHLIDDVTQSTTIYSWPVFGKHNRLLLGQFLFLEIDLTDSFPYTEDLAS